MKFFWGISLLIILSHLCHGASWEPIQRVSENEWEKRLPLIHHCPTLQVTHIFWEEMNHAGDLYLMYRRRLANSSFTPTMLIDNVHPLAFYENLVSVQSTEDCQRIFLSYGAYRAKSGKGCTKRNMDGCLEVIFTESSDGGNTWTTPARIKREDMEDTDHRSLPSIVYQEETGYLWIAYYINMYAAMVVRKPGSTTFEKESRLSLYMFGRILHMGYTIELSTTWLHMVWYEDDLSKTKSIYYARSSDLGENWTKRLTLVEKYEGDNLPSLAINNRAYPGGIYVQYSDKKIVELLWSKNHGKSWEEKIKVGNAYSPHNTVAICGRPDTRSIVVTMGPGFSMVAGFMKYLDAGFSELKSLSYPFGGIKNMASPVLTCSVGGKWDITILSAVVDTTEKEVLFIKGTFPYESKQE